MRTLIVAIALVGCQGATSPSSVADKFVDRYYVESDQKSALKLTTGVATMRLNAELKLVEGAAGPDPRQTRVYYKRTRLDETGDTRTADYDLDIRPQGGGAMTRGAHLELKRDPDGSWRVARFSETQPR